MNSSDEEEEGELKKAPDLRRRRWRSRSAFHPCAESWVCAGAFLYEAQFILFVWDVDAKWKCRECNLNGSPIPGSLAIIYFRKFK